VSVNSTSEVHQRIVAEAQQRDSDGQAVIATDAGGCIVYWNERATTLYGWAPADALGKNILDVTPTRQTQDEAARIMETLLAGAEWSGDFIVRHRNGSPLLMHVTDIPVMMAGTVVGIIGMSRPERRDSPRSVPRIST
jgi:PAS domain S-box-containing protein